MIINVCVIDVEDDDDVEDDEDDDDDNDLNRCISLLIVRTVTLMNSSTSLTLTVYLP